MRKKMKQYLNYIIHLGNSIMTRQKLAIALLIPFTILSLYAIQQVGYIGIFDYQVHSPAGWQVFCDLVIACVLTFVWIIPDAKRFGRNPWPYFVITIFLGSFGPLLYLALSSSNKELSKK